MHQISVAVLGAPGVGKTSICRQFTQNEHSEKYIPSQSRQVYHPVILLNDQIFQLRLLDYPPLSRFPDDTLEEWDHFRCFGIRTASAYILVYDVTAYGTFHFVRQFREQMAEQFDLHSVPVLIVANKTDLLPKEQLKTSLTYRREIANLVRKQWRCGFVECSARYNSHIHQLFKELVKLCMETDLLRHSQHKHSRTRRAFQAVRDNFDQLGDRRCQIM